MATNLPMTILHADPSEIMDVADAARQLAPLITHHDEASLTRLLQKNTRYVELTETNPRTVRHHSWAWHSRRLFS